MNAKRFALAGLIAATLVLTSCVAEPTEPAGTTSPTPTPTATPTAATVEPPADEAEAIAAAEEATTRWLTVSGEVEAAGGHDTAPLEEVATGNALEVSRDSAHRIANGPLLNEDRESIEGQATVEGSITYETIGAYGQPWEGIENGLVTIQACEDYSGYFITTADGKPAMRNPAERTTVDYQVIYSAERQIWLVYDIITLGGEC